MRQDCQAVGAYFIGNVTVGSDAIGTHPYGVDLALRHQTGSHGVANQPIRNTQLAQLPGGQAATLQQRPGFIHPHLLHFALLMGA
ncbi:hypothetical protein D3C76_1413720 [compost metagenome]